jgi:ABC-2 type transport system permease protein
MLKIQCIALYTLIRREVVRMFNIKSQTFLPPVITTLLYFIIFGHIVGGRIGPLEGHPYNTFIAPGLVMLAVINNAFNNVVSSFFIARFQRSIEEMLVSPMHWGVLILGFTMGGIIRGLINGTLVIFVAYLFTDISLTHLIPTLGLILLVSALFAMAGFLNGMLAKNFDEIAFIPTFILTPLIYLGGIFYSKTMLTPFWQKIMLLNPVYCIIGATRQIMLGTHEINMPIAIASICTLCVILATLNCILIRKGVGIRE